MVSTLEISIVTNIILFFILYRTITFFGQPGKPNFMVDSIMVAFNRWKNPTLVAGATNDKSFNLYWKKENQPIVPTPGYNGLSLQFEPRNQFHGWRGLPVVFGFENFLSNTNPLEIGNNDVELTLIAQANEAYVQAEVARINIKNNPFKKLQTIAIIQIAIMVLGFFILGYILINFQSTVQAFSKQALDAYKLAQPAIDEFIRQSQLKINENLSPGVTVG